MTPTDTTPMMLQYTAAKQQHAGEILFFRMGDFYEMFFEDAKEAAAVLGIALTSRSKGPDAVPMAGVPVKAARQYIRRLLAAGKRVAICEQVEDPALATGLVDREVVRVVTPGTMIDEGCIEERSPLYLLALAPGRTELGLAWVDLSTGEFSVLETRDERLAQAEIERVAPAECLVPAEIARDGAVPALRGLAGTAITPYPDWNFAPDVGDRQLREHFKAATLSGFGIERIGPAVGAAGALLRYLYETQRHDLGHITAIRVHEPARFLRVDERARRALELVRNARGTTQGTVLQHLDRTATAMGGRLLKAWLLEPLAERALIEERLDAVEHFCRQSGARQALRETLDDLADIERLAGRLALGTAHGRDLVALGRSLSLVPRVRELIAASAPPPLVQANVAALGDFAALCQRIAETLVDDPPLAIKEGGLIRAGVSPALDELRSLAHEGDAWLGTFQQAEIERTGIPNLRVGYK
jgi:DNA mismatch repair protein MutS